MEVKQAIILFTKVPYIGYVKTRLVRDGFTAEEACQLYMNLLKDTAVAIHGAVTKKSLLIYIYYSPAEAHLAQFKSLHSIYSNSMFIEQRGLDVTERVRNAFVSVFGKGNDAAILIPGDHDDLDSTILCKALNYLTKSAKLKKPQIVIGPTYDGGAYLLGLNRYTTLHCINNLQDTYRVCYNVISYARSHSIPHKILDVRMDIDDLDDVLRVAARRRKLNTHTENYLKNLIKTKKLVPVNRYSLSIIVPTLNEENWVRRALTSVSRQNVDSEVIVVDGGSDDNTLQLVADLADKVVMLGEASRKTQENIGAYAARGEILLFLHADMFLPQGSLAKVIEAFKDRSVAAGSLDAFFDVNKTKYTFIRYVRQIMSRVFNIHGVGAAFCIRRNMFYRLGGFDENFMEEAVALSKKIRQIGKLTKINAPVIVSARRFEKKGYVRTMIIWALTVLLTLIGCRSTWLERKFWKGLNKKS